MITANEASRERWLTGQPDLLTTSTNRNLLQPTKDNKARRESNIKETVKDVTRKTRRKHSRSRSGKGKARSTSSEQQQGVANGEEGRAPMMRGMLRHHSSTSSSAKSDRSQLVDLVVEDTAAEDTERVRARKEGSAGWNAIEPKRFVLVNIPKTKDNLTIFIAAHTGKTLVRIFERVMSQQMMWLTLLTKMMRMNRSLSVTRKTKRNLKNRSSGSRRRSQKSCFSQSTVLMERHSRMFGLEGSHRSHHVRIHDDDDVQ